MKHTDKILTVLEDIIQHNLDENSLKILQDLGLNEEEIEETYDIIASAYFAGQLVKNGAEHESDLDDNPIYQKTKEIVINSADEWGEEEEKEVNFAELLEKFHNPQNDDDKSDALYELIDNNYPNLLPLIEQSLFDKDEYVQLYAVQGIEAEYFNNDAFATKVFQLFTETEDHNLISNLTQLFSDFNINKALPYVIEKLKNNNSMIVFDCIRCCGEIGNQETIDILKPFLQNDEIPEILDEYDSPEVIAPHSIKEETSQALAKLMLKIN